MRRLQRIVRREKGDDRLRPVVDFQLSVDRREVKFYGMDSHAQATGDLSIRHTFCHQLHNLLLTRRERARWAGSVVHTMTVKAPTLEHLQAKRTEASEGPSQLARPHVGGGFGPWTHHRCDRPDSASLELPPVGSPSSVAMWKAGVPRDPVVGRRRRRWRGCRLEGLANRSGALE